MKEELTTLKENYDNLEIAYELAIDETHVATNNVAKLDVATYCDDLWRAQANVLFARARKW